MRSAVRVSWLTCVLAAAGASALRAPVQPRSRALAMAWPGVGLSREAAPEVVEAESRKIADEKGLWMDRALTVFIFVVPVALGDTFGVMLKPVAGGDAGVLGSFMLILAALLYINADDAAWSDLFDNRPMVDNDVLLAFQAFDSNRSGKLGASAPALLLEGEAHAAARDRTEARARARARARDGARIHTRLYDDGARARARARARTRARAGRGVRHIALLPPPLSLPLGGRLQGADARAHMAGL